MCILPLKSSYSHAQEPLDSFTSFKYYVHFVDDFIRFISIYPTKQKSEIVQAFTQFKNLTKNQFNIKTKVIHCDGEYKDVKKIPIEADILFKMSYPFTSHQNGRVVRKTIQIADFGLTVLA